MTSKESLEIIELILNNHSNMLEVNDKRNECLNVIKKDLERLEEINKVWHENEVMESVDINAKHLQELYEYIIYANKQNEKLKKAIEIMRNKKVDVRLLLLHNLKDYNFLIGNSYQLTKQEYELLKEVLD